MPQYTFDYPLIHEKAFGKMLMEINFELDERQEIELLDLIEKAITTREFMAQLVPIKETKANLAKISKHANALLNCLQPLDPRSHWYLACAIDAGCPDDGTIGAMRNRLQIQMIVRQLSLLHDTASRALLEFEKGVEEVKESRGLQKVRSERSSTLPRDALIQELQGFYERVAGRRASYTTDPIENTRRGRFFDFVRTVLAYVSVFECFDGSLESGAIGEVIRRVKDNPPIRPTEE